MTARVVASAFFCLGQASRLGSQHDQVEGLDTDQWRVPCAARDWTMHVKPNVHHNPNTPWKREEERDYTFHLPQAQAGWFRAAIHEAPCPAFARHPDGIATFNCERNGEWRMTKEKC